MNTLVKAFLFSISTAIIAVPAMAATQHKEPVHHTVKHEIAPVKHDQHKHTAKKDVKKHHTPAKKAPVHHDAKHDVKHR